MADIYFWRQIFILFTGLLTAFSTGFMVSFPAVLSPALTASNSTDIKTTGNHATWIGAIFGIGGFFGSLLLSPIMQRFGRKAVQYCLSMSLAIGWIILVLAKDVTTIYVGRIIQGLSAGAVYINSIIIGEYVHPTRRGYFIALKKVTVAVGTLCCHSMGTIWTWRQIAIFAAVPAILASIMTYFWPESPPFLALRGRFTECNRSFHWLNGYKRDNQEELKELTEAQKENIKSDKKSFKEVMSAFKKRSFQRAFILSSLLTFSVDLTGKFYLMAYLSQVMKELLGNSTSAVYYTLGADSVSVLALSLSTVVIRFYNRRTVLFSTGLLCIVLMILISVLVYLKNVYTFPKFLFGFTALVLILQYFIVNIGLAPVSYAIVGEIFPLENRGMGACISGAFCMILYTLTMKLIPLLITYIGFYGILTLLAVLLAICCGVLYQVLPETKDRTLQDIEDEMK